MSRRLSVEMRFRILAAFRSIISMMLALHCTSISIDVLGLHLRRCLSTHLFGFLFLCTQNSYD